MREYTLACLILTLVAISCGSVHSGCQRQSSKELKTFSIDLGAPATQHFAETAAYFRQEIALLIEAEKYKRVACSKTMRISFLKVFLFSRKILNFGPELVKLVELVAAEVDRLFPQPFSDEIRGIAAAGNFNLGDIVFFNLIYDLTT